MNAVARGERRISARSGHGVGKTTVLAWIIIWWVLTRFPQKTVCTAPTSDQLFDALAAEVKSWILHLPPAVQELLEVQSEKIFLRAAPDESFISFRTSRQEKPEALAGVHSANVLLIGDEASGIPNPVFEAAAGSMSGHTAVTILAGNPVRGSGLFYDTFHKLSDLWYRVHISCVGHPRISPDFVEDMRRRYGERSNAFRVRVLGEFPLADDDTIIPRELAEDALDRDVEAENVKPIWGLDCARFGMDRSALCKRKGNVLLEPVESWQGLDTMETVGRVKQKWDTTPPSRRPDTICVDAIGVGAGVADRLRELGLPARAINVSESPALGDKYRNLKAELWFKSLDWFNTRAVNVANDIALVNELVAVKYKFTSNGKTQVESKDEMKKRGALDDHSSPDLADAFVLTFAVPAVSALYGSSGSRSWSQPLVRKIKGLV